METNKMSQRLDHKYSKKLLWRVGSVLSNGVYALNGNGPCLGLKVLAGERL